MSLKDERLSPCEICKGACCETVIQQYSDKDELEWMLLRGKLKYVSCVEFELKCMHLTDGGRCGIYEDRPHACRIYKVGSELCRTAVKERRSEEIHDKVMKAIENEAG